MKRRLVIALIAVLAAAGQRQNPLMIVIMQLVPGRILRVASGFCGGHGIQCGKPPAGHRWSGNFIDRVFDTGAYRTDDYVHILVRVDGVIAGFHTYLESGRSLGGVLGGFNRAHTRNHFVYERVILASLEYALARNLCRVNYSLIDDRTKLRLVGSRVPCALYLYSRNAVNSKVFDVTYRYNDIYWPACET